MKVNLENFQGNIMKTVTIESDDPDNPRQVLKLRGVVKAIITIKPSPNISFTGSTGRLSRSVVDLQATKTPFHIKSIDTNLTGKIDYSIRTVTDGTHYRLKVSNKVRQGGYSGFIRLETDLPRAPWLLVRVMAAIKGAISASPETVLIGKLDADNPVRSGAVTLVSGDDKPFKITALSYDKELMSVTGEKLENQNGYLLKIVPKLGSIGRGTAKQATIGVQTDIKTDGKTNVLVYIFNNSSGPRAGRRLRNNM